MSVSWKPNFGKHDSSIFQTVWAQKSVDETWPNSYQKVTPIFNHKASMVSWGGFFGFQPEAFSPSTGDSREKGGKKREKKEWWGGGVFSRQKGGDISYWHRSFGIYLGIHEWLIKQIHSSFKPSRLWYALHGPRGFPLLKRRVNRKKLRRNAIQLSQWLLSGISTNLGGRVGTLGGGATTIDCDYSDVKTRLTNLWSGVNVLSK